MSETESAADYWEARYGEREQIWSGRPNDALVDTMSGRPPGRALDLGCGEGGDTVWLASQGWEVTAVDISTTAVDRARARAAASGISTRQVTWVVEDLGAWRPAGEYELASACFLHSTVEFPRTDILRRAAGAVARGGHLLVVGHAEPPPWFAAHEEREEADGSQHGHHHSDHDFLGPAEELAALELDEAAWEVAVSEVRRRESTGPDGEPAVLLDTVVLARRR